MSDAVIQVDHVWKKFRKGEVHDSLRELIPAFFKRLTGHKPPKNELQNREFWALRDVSFEVKRGESLGIIGPNGAGKSTMLKLLSRILKPNRGEYRINGRISALIEVGAGFHPDLTGRENIYLNGTILGMRKAEIKAKEEAIIDFSGIDSFIDTPVKRYSSGMNARLGFAVAAHMEPDVLLVDEVLSVGDARFRAKCLNHMLKLLKSETTVVFISHILDQVRALCPNTLVLDAGAVIYNGETDGAIRAYMDVLGRGSGSTSTADCDAEIRDICLLDAEGREVLDWKVRQPSMIEFELVLRKHVDEPSVIINVASLGGVHLGTINSQYDGLVIPSEPGGYRVRCLLDPMPLNDGNFSLECKVHSGADQMVCVWSAAEPLRVGIRGGRVVDTLVVFDGQWTVRHDTAMPGAAPTPRAQLIVSGNER